MTRTKKALLGFGLVGVMGLTYCLAAFTEVPLLSTARTLWIETAMTTGDHQWLAQIFPPSVIRKVMEQQSGTIDDVAGLPEQNTPSASGAEAPLLRREDAERAIDELKQRAEGKGDTLGQERAAASGVDAVGNEVLVNDEAQGVMISLVRNATYTGRLVQVDDPSRVFVASTGRKGFQGQLICDYLQEYNAILGVNASGFADYGGNGLGGEVIGATRAQGEDWGQVMHGSMTIGFDAQNRLLAGKIVDWDAYQLRDAIQFGPVLIKDGEILTEGSSGWGLQPRTVIGQRADGVVLILVMDGRKPGYSIGATMGDCAQILKAYGCVTAAACDGGSSSVLAYNGELINKPSTPMETGRYLPNAFLVKRR